MTFTVIWVVWIVSGLVVEAVALFNDWKNDTLSWHFRHWFRVDTHVGRSIWLVSWGGFAVWFLIHILIPGFVG